MKLSIVIPAFNESKKIGNDIEAACEFLHRNKIEGEVIIANDGSTDKTAEEAIQAGQNSPPQVKVKVISHPNKGKGFAIRKGMKETSGDFVMFADSGNCIPYDNALQGIELISTGQCDIAHGSRNLASADIKKDHSLYRHICSEMFHYFAIKVMKVPAEFTDTQCGFKVYRGDIGRELFADCITDGFMFDIEVILRALKKGYRIKEFPVYWSCDIDSRLSPAKSFSRIFGELIKIKSVLKAEK
jgi:dolichyl-phosphate beta-glucosyltransferase